MISSFVSSALARAKSFARREDGSTNTVSFAIWTPILLLTLATAIEVGIYTARSTMLERGMDMAVRDVRLSTGENLSHDQIKDSICNYAGIIPDCGNALRLEMMIRDPDAWSAIPTRADCTDRALAAAPVREFTAGQDNQLMVMRACTKVEPIFPTTWLSNAMNRDTAGDFAIVALSAFVQEPR